MIRKKSFSGVLRFSDLLKSKIIYPDFNRGCIVDTSILFALSYPNDYFNNATSELFDYLAELKIAPYTNVNIRAEFINNQFQVLVPEALSDLYTSHTNDISSKLYGKLQSNYTTMTEARKTGKSYKFSNTKIEEWRKLFREENQQQQDGWFDFCSSYISHRIKTIWTDTCDASGINFLSLRGSDAKKWVTGPINWNDMDLIVGNFGIGSFDAMIINLFMNSHFEAIITADKELAKTVSKISNGKKLVFVPDSLNFN